MDEEDALLLEDYLTERLKTDGLDLTITKFPVKQYRMEKEYVEYSDSAANRLLRLLEGSSGYYKPEIR